MITDLTSTSSTGFQTEANDWVISNARNTCPTCSIYTTPPNSCGIAQEIIYGGPGILGTSGGTSQANEWYGRTYTGLSLNIPAALEFDLWAFYDSVPSSPTTHFLYTVFNSGSGVFKSFDAVLVSSCELDYTDAGGVVIKALYKYRVRFLFVHAPSNSLEKKSYSRFTVASTVSSFGFRNLKYYFDSTIPINSPISAANFPCTTNSYWTGSACAACPAKCSVCTGPTSNECTVCNNGYYKYGNGTCSSVCPSLLIKSTVDGIKYCNSPCPNQYIYYDGTCSTDCLAPLVKADESSDIKYCRSPCADINAYIFKNGSCSGQCLSPLAALTVKGNKFCNSPCPNQYIYYDETCSTDCLAPLVKADESDIKYCRTPCANVNDYIFKNGTCTNQCFSPLVASTVKGNKFCNSPCPNQYIYYDETCSTDCLAPLVKADESDIKYCRSPCADTNAYIFKNGTCTNQCLSPLVASTVKGNKFCNSPCSSQYIYYDGTCSTDCLAPLVKADESSDIKYCRSPCTDTNAYIFTNGSCTGQCLSPLVASTVKGNKFCNSPCSSQYIYYDGACSTDCLAPLVKADESSDIKYCRTPCANVNDYIFKNGTCTNQCLSPLVASTVKGNKFCNSPCPNQYIYYDGTCSTDCLAPLVKADESSDIKYCRSPCTDTNAYIFTNGSCTSQCFSPLVASTVKGNKFCNSPCPNQYIYIDGSCSTDCLTPLVKADESSDIKYCRTPCAKVNDYIYPNGTCTSQCSSLLVKSTVKGNNFCKSPCPGQYIYYDGTCSTECMAPMVQRAESTIKFCVSPCQNPQDYFYEVDQRCFPACSDPYESQKIYNLKFCFLSEKLSLEQVREIKGMAASLTTANKVGAVVGQVTASMSSSSSIWAFLAAQVSMLFSIRYIDVGYPDKVKLMFKLQGASPFSISFDFNVPDGVEKRLVKRSPPKIFEEYEVLSNFLENSWDTLMTLMLALFSILALSLVKKLLKGKCSAIGSILGGVLSFLKWNIPLMIFCSSFGDMYFFASLQFQSGISDSTAWEIISLILAILLVIIGVPIIIIPVKIAKTMLLRDQNFEKWKSFEHLFDGQKRTSLVSLCFLAIYLTATIISNLLITNLYASPLCESLLITMISAVMFLFLVIQRPFRELKTFFQVLVNQLLLMTANVCVVILAIMDDLEIGKQDIRDKVGEAIIVIFFCSMASGLVFATIEMFFTLFEMFKFLKELKVKQGSISFKGIFDAFFHGDPIEKSQEKHDLEPRRKRQTAAHRQGTDLSFGGKLALQPSRKGKSPQKNLYQRNLNISYQDSNTSGIDLIRNQSSDYSFDLPNDSGHFHLSPSKLSRSRAPLQRNTRLNHMNRQVFHQNSDYSVEVLSHSPPPRGFAPTLKSKVKQNKMSQLGGKNERRVQKTSNVSNIKRKTNKATTQSRSCSPKRKNQIQKERIFF